MKITKKKNINLFLLADSENSLKTLIELVKKREKNNVSNTNINTVKTIIGKLTYSDLELARITNSAILSFNIPLDHYSSNYAKENNIKFVVCYTIYQADDVINKLITHIKKKYLLKKNSRIENKSSLSIFKEKYCRLSSDRRKTRKKQPSASN